MRTVDVSNKPKTLRSARAYGRIRLRQETIRAILEGRVPKGDVLSACRLAGIMATKKTSQLLPFCHPISLEHAEINLKVGEDTIEVFSLVKGIERTGYEMEALTAVCVALLTIYDMCKGMDDSMLIEEVRLLEKEGGKSQWGHSLGGIKVKVEAGQELRGVLEGYLKAFGAELVEEDFSMFIKVGACEPFEPWGISHVINQQLFSLFPSRFKEGVKVGMRGGVLCVCLQEDEDIIRAFFENFGMLMGNWLHG